MTLFQENASTPRAISASVTLPQAISPMLARLARGPFDSAEHIFELKWDGIRALLFIEDGRVRIQGRDLQDLTHLFPELANAAKYVRADNTVFDGELVCFDDDGHPSFEQLQRRMRRRASGRVVRTPAVHFVAFDVLYIRGKPVMDEPLDFRKLLLENILEPGNTIQPSEFIEGDGIALYDATGKHGLEGIMAKEKSSAYYPGKRSPSWHKIKRVRECDFIVGGYTFGGKRREPFASLLLGLYDGNQRLSYVGKVETGFTPAETKRIYGEMEALVTPESPFETIPYIPRFMYWCRPEMVARVSYGEFSYDGQLRFPVYMHSRHDAPPADCKLEDAPGWPSILPVG